MGFRMSCDRCGRFMRNVKVTDLKKMSDNEIVCPVCSKIEEKVHKDINRLKLVANGQLEKLVSGFREQIVEIMQKHIEESNGRDTA